MHQPSAHENKAGWLAAVDTVVACDSVNQSLTCLWALTCHLTADSFVLAANNPAPSIAEGSGVFLFRASGRRLNVGVPLVETLFLRGLNTWTDGLTVTRLYFHTLSRNSAVLISERSTVTLLQVSRMHRTILPSLHRMCCSTQNCQSKAQ